GGRPGQLGAVHRRRAMKLEPGLPGALESAMLTKPAADPISAAAGVSREAAPFMFLRQAQAQGVRGALVAISAIDGGAPRPLGTHMAVLEDGRHAGHVSGGCVEAAIAAEVVPIITRGTDEI